MPRSFPSWSPKLFPGQGSLSPTSSRIGVVIGPGAFAGVRVGLAFARGLCLGTSARAVGVTSLQALAASVGERRLIAPVFDARRGQVYAALYDENLHELVAPFVAAPQDAAARLAHDGVMLAGSGAAMVSSFLQGDMAISETTMIDPIALARLARDAAEPSSPPAPLYLRPPDAAPSAAGLFAGLGAS